MDFSSMGGGIGDLIQAGGAYLNTQAQIDAAERQGNVNYDRQKEFARMGIQWRVADAKEAGLHPLFALSGGGAAFAPNPITVGGSGIGSAMEKMGQGVSRAAAASMTTEQRQVQDAQLKLLAAQTDKETAHAQFLRSQASGGASGPGNPPFPSVYPQLGDEMSWPARMPAAAPHDLRHAFDASKYTPAEVGSVREATPHVAAGTAGAASMEVRLGGVPILLPRSNDVGEALEGMLNPVVFAMWLQENVDHYGPGWLRSAMKKIPGLKQAIETGEGLAQRLHNAGSGASERAAGRTLRTGRIQRNSFRDRPFYGWIPEVGY